jgi:hypothetical protein
MHKLTHNIPCIGCGALVPDIEGPTLRYPDAVSPGCWAVFEEILALDYGPFNYLEVHHLTVDTCAARPACRATPPTTQSVTLHLVSPGCVPERGHTLRRAIKRYEDSFEGCRRSSLWARSRCWMWRGAQP